MTGKTLTFDLDLSNGGLGTEVENDILFEDIPFFISAPGAKSSRMLRNLGHASVLEHLNTPFVLEDKKVNPSIFGARVFR